MKINKTRERERKINISVIVMAHCVECGNLYFTHSYSSCIHRRTSYWRCCVLNNWQHSIPNISFLFFSVSRYKSDDDWGRKKGNRREKCRKPLNEINNYGCLELPPSLKHQFSFNSLKYYFTFFFNSNKPWLDEKLKSVEVEITWRKFLSVWNHSLCNVALWVRTPKF